jgi:pyruvate/2-oxoglutarate dehydrogenase complex dihydrolipoamide dehydrogenase (E3) component
MSEPADLAVLGGGTAALVAAKTAAGLGARVVLAESDRTGGECLWTGCVPSKALLAAARAAQTARDGARFGIAAREPLVDFPAVMEHVHAAIAAVEPHDSPEFLRQAGVRVLSGRARFTAPATLRVGDEVVAFRRAVIATGSEPAIPPTPGLAEAGPLTSDTVWGLDTMPKRLLVLGGGPIGCELGQAFARLGSEVTILEAAARLLPAEEAAAGELLTARLPGEGACVRTGATVTAAYGTAGDLRVELRAGDGAPETITADQVLVATGRRPRTAGLGLETVSVRTGKNGHVAVDSRLRTTNHRIYAAGDVTGLPAFTHVAGVAGSVAASNAVLAPVRRLDLDRLPWVAFTDPEIAHTGLTEAQARARHGASVRVRTLEHSAIDRPIIEGDTAGFTHVVLDRRARVLGATIVAPRAGEMINEVTSISTRGGHLRDLASVIHPYPGWGDAVWHAAVAEWQDTTAAAPAARRGVVAARALSRAADRLLPP